MCGQDSVVETQVDKSKQTRLKQIMLFNETRQYSINAVYVSTNVFICVSIYVFIYLFK